MSWSKALLKSGKRFRIPALLLLAVASKVDQETSETMLDYLIGSIAIDTNDTDLPQIYSPLREYYTGEEMRQLHPELFYETLSHLTVLRARLRDHQQASERALGLGDIIIFVDMYLAADERMINSSPYNQRTDAVQVMTVYKAKGLEFEHVFLVSLQDDVWGSTSRTQSNRLVLPANLAPIRHAGATDDERLRILFVALTRAKFGLYLTSVAQNYSGKATKRLKYLDEREQDTTIKSMVLPLYAQTVQREDTTPPPLELLELDWRHRHIGALYQASLKSLLESRLTHYQLSPTHLNTFLDLQYGGPERFFFSTILRFPEAPSLDSQFGAVIHETLEWVQHRVTDTGTVPTITDAVEYFALRMRNKKLTVARTALEIERGEAALTAYLTSRSGMFKQTDKAEFTFRNEGAFVDNVHLAGKVDRLEIDHAKRHIVVVDYKTGKSFNRWLSNEKLYHYKRQLYCYKLLVEHSAVFRGYRVTHGRLEFIEPDTNGRINALELRFNDDELEHVKLLLVAMWRAVKDLDFPSTIAYRPNLSGIQQFEKDLIDGMKRN